MRRVIALCAVLSMIVLVAGCGGDTRVTYSRGVIHVGTGVNDISLTKSVLGIRVGSRESHVRHLLGEPFVRVAAGRFRCWGYHADQGGSSTSERAASSLDGLSFCMNPTSHRVAKIQLAAHG